METIYDFHPPRRETQADWMSYYDSMKMFEGKKLADRKEAKRFYSSANKRAVKHRDPFKFTMTTVRGGFIVSKQPLTQADKEMRNARIRLMMEASNLN